jgi:hypothetical protein
VGHVRRVVILSPDYGPLYLTDVRRNAKGITSGYVVNGAWTLRIRGDTFLACDGEEVVTRKKVSQFVIVPVPDDMQGDYNTIIAWVEKEVGCSS